MLSLIGQLMFDGLAMGLVFVVLAGGFVLITSVSKIIFVAYGVFYTIGAFGTWYAVHDFNMPYYAALIIGTAAAALIAYLSYLLIFQRLQRLQQGFLATLIASMGLSMVLTQGGQLIYGTQARSIPNMFSGVIYKFGLHINVDKLVLITLGIAITLFLFWVHEKTTLGRQFRAVAFNKEAASLQGVDVSRINLIILVMSCALAGFAGGILAPSYGISSQMGASVLWTIMLMTMLGGMDSLIGAVVAGLIIGQCLSFGQYFIGSVVQVFIFLFIGVILYFKPNGLFGHGVDVGI